ncbi:MAG: hypothetical protein SF162_17555 [bacterium]|nr:hypothetical protein [bacterium]
MIERFTGQLPAWARPTHPVLRHELGTGSVRLPWQARYGRALGVVLVGALLLLIGVLAATDLFRRAAGQNSVETVNAILYFPALIVQVILRVAAFALTSGTVGEQIRLGNWDNLRATESGAELTLRAKWVSVFYRLRGLFGVVIALRVGLIGLLLYDLTAFQGRYLDLFIVGITPEVPLVLAVLLLSLLMTAVLLLPVTAAGFDAAMGLLLSASVQQRTYTTLLQAVYILVRIGILVLVVGTAETFLRGELPATDPVAWLLLFALGALGDWGLAFLYLGRFGEIWAIVPYGILLGLAILIFSLIQAALADAVLAFAARRAQRRG